MELDKVIEQVKLVPEDNLCPAVACYVYLQDVIEEGIRSTFGLRTKDAMLLRLAVDLLAARTAAAKADELQRTIKGLQLENGRLKKALERAKSEQDATTGP